LRALGKCFELHFGQKTVAKLDGPKVVEDHVAPSRAHTARSLLEKARRRLECRIFCILLAGGRGVNSGRLAFRGRRRKRQRGGVDFAAAQTI